MDAGGSATQEAKAEGAENRSVNSISSALPLSYFRARPVLRCFKRIQTMA